MTPSHRGRDKEDGDDRVEGWAEGIHKVLSVRACFFSIACAAYIPPHIQCPVSLAAR